MDQLGGYHSPYVDKMLFPDAAEAEDLRPECSVLEVSRKLKTVEFTIKVLRKITPAAQDAHHGAVDDSRNCVVLERNCQGTEPHHPTHGVSSD